MEHIVSKSPQVCFGLFKADLETGEIWKGDQRLKLQSQPFRVLRVLLEHPGEIVTREALQSLVWGPNVTVDYEQSLGSAIKKIREAIQDSAENPRFIETVPRKGYRFIAPVIWADERDSDPEPRVATLHVGSETVSLSRHAYRRYVAFTVVCAIVVALCAETIRVWDLRHQQTPPVRISQITYDGRIYSEGLGSFETLPATVADGERLFTSSILDRHAVLSQVSAKSGDLQQLQLPSEVTDPEINDLSRDGGELLVLGQSTVGFQPEQPLWIIPTHGGSASRVANVLAHAAVWMPDQKTILYATGNDLNEVSQESGASKHFATVPGRAFWMRWSPDGTLLRFTIVDPKDYKLSLWELGKDRREARQILNSWKPAENMCCGVWTPDGRLYVFQVTHEGHNDLWHVSGLSDAKPVQVTNGPLDYEAPAAGRDGERIYFQGRNPHGEWKEQEFEAGKQRLEPRRDFLSAAVRVTFSRDREWVAWTDAFGHLWRARVDGTEKLQLTPDSIQVLYNSWSPDGSSLALMAHGQSEAWRIYRIPFSGGALEDLLPADAGGAGNPSYSADGRLLLFGGLPYPVRSLAILDLKTRQIKEVPNSAGFHSPRWSPDGHYIAALDADQRQLMLYELATGKWKALLKAPISDPVWVSDSRAIYINAYTSSELSIYHVSVPEGRVEREVIPGCGQAATRCFLSGVTPDDVPLIVVEMIKSDLYSMDFLHK